jgi:hypothetical protein
LLLSEIWFSVEKLRIAKVGGLKQRDKIDNEELNFEAYVNLSTNSSKQKKFLVIAWFRSADKRRIDASRFWKWNFEWKTRICCFFFNLGICHFPAQKLPRMHFWTYFKS